MCWAPLGSSPLYCDICGSSLDSAEAIRLTELDRDLAALSSRVAMLSAERAALVERIRRLRPPTPTTPVVSAELPPPPPGPMPLHASEWRPESLGVMLLWAGVALLALASLIFAIVAWPSIGDLGRLGVLAVATLGVGGAWLGSRERLVLTSEALSALFISMLLVDWQVGYVAAVDGRIDVALWWTIGLILVGGAGAAMGGFAGQKTPRILAGLLVAISGVVLVAGMADSVRLAVVGLMVVVTLLTIAAFVVAEHETWRGFAISVSLVSASVWVVAFFMVLLDASIESNVGALITAGVIITLAVPLVVLRVASKRLRTDQPLDAVVGFIVVMLAIWSVLVLLAMPVDSDSIIVAAAAVGLVVCVVSRVVVGRVSGGWWAGGLVTMAVSAIPASTVSVFLLGRLLDVLDTGGASFGSSTGASSDALGESVRLLLNLDASAYDSGVFFPANDFPVNYVSLGLTRAALAVLVMVVAGAIFELIGLPGYRRRFPRGVSLAVGCAAFVGAATLVPFAVPLSVVTSVIVMMAATVVVAVASAVMARNEQTPSVFAVGGVVVLGSLWTLGWLFGLVNVWSTVATLGVGVGVAVMLGVSVRSVDARSAWVAVAATATLGFAVVLADALGAVSSELAFVGVVVGGLIVIAIQWLVSKPGARVPTEVVSLVAMGSGVLYATAEGNALWGARALSVAVPVFALAGIENDRRGYRWAAAVCAVLAWWAWLVEFEVDLVEAFTLPAAVVALGAGWLATRSHPEVSSWSAYGAGLVMGTAPSLAVLVADGGALRGVLMSAALLVIVLLGVLLRLQAPVVVGVVALLVLGIDTLWPVAAQVQRWILIAIAGAVLVWLGATFERRWRDLRRVSGLLGRLG